MVHRFMKLKQYIFDYLRKKMPERNPRFPHLDQPLKVMIVYESDLLERNDAIKSIRQDLLRRQMDVTMWGYVEKKVINTLILPQSLDRPDDKTVFAASLYYHVHQRRLQSGAEHGRRDTRYAHFSTRFHARARRRSCPRSLMAL